jgi:hypothetical protein
MTLTIKEKIKQSSRLYYLNNKEKIKEYQKEYDLKNLDKIKEYQKKYQNKYYLNNKDKAKKYYKEYYLKNIDKAKKQNQEYNLKNPHIKNTTNAKRRAKKLNATPKFADLRKIKEIYRNCPKGYHVDHIIPLNSKVVCGLHVEWNLQYLPARENIRKGNKLLNY